jgi:anti-sigma B factor antagonist
VDEEVAASPNLALELALHGEAATVTVKGELDVAGAPHFIDLCDSIHAHGGREVVLDLTETTFLDSSGLRGLIGAQHRFGDAGGAVKLLNPSAAVMRLLEITGLTSYFTIGSA